MSEQRLAIYSSVFTVLSLILVEGVLYHYLPKDDYGSFVYMRFNLLTIAGLFFACNFTFVFAAFRRQPSVLRKNVLKKSLLYSFCICLMIVLQVTGLQHHIQNTDPAAIALNTVAIGQ